MAGLKMIFLSGILGIVFADAPANAQPAPNPSGDAPTNGVFHFGQETGYLLLPPDYRPGNKHPLILHFHGRGGTPVNSNLMTEEFALFRRKALERGYVMVTPAYGSESWMNASAEDIALKCLEAIRTRLSIDDNRIFILGCSMGGGAALTFAGRHPDKVTAVCDVFGMTDFDRYYRAGFYCQSISNAFAGSPDEKPAVYRERSGLSYVEQLKSMPLLIIHGDRDSCVPLWNSQVLVEQMQVAGGHPKLIVVPGKGHDNTIIQGLEDTVLDHFDAVSR